MKNSVIITVRYLFDGGDAWGNIEDFESDLKDFLSAYGKDAVVVRNIEGAPSGDLFLIVQTVDETGMEQFIRKSEEKTLSPKETLNKLEKGASKISEKGGKK